MLSNQKLLQTSQREYFIIEDYYSEREEYYVHAYFHEDRIKYLPGDVGDWFIFVSSSLLGGNNARKISRSMDGIIKKGRILIFSCEITSWSVPVSKQTLYTY